MEEELTGINTVTKSARCARAMPARCCVFRWRRSARLWAGMRFSSLRAICCPMCCIDISSSWPGSAIGTLSSVSDPFSIRITFLTHKPEVVDHVVVDWLRCWRPLAKVDVSKSTVANKANQLPCIVIIVVVMFPNVITTS